MPGRRVRHSWQEKQGAQTLEGWSTGTLGQKRVLELLVASDRNCSKQLKLEKGVGGIQWLKVLQGVGRGGMGWGGVGWGSGAGISNVVKPRSLSTLDSVLHLHGLRPRLETAHQFCTDPLPAPSVWPFL